MSSGASKLERRKGRPEPTSGPASTPAKAHRQPSAQSPPRKKPKPKTNGTKPKATTPADTSPTSKPSEPQTAESPSVAPSRKGLLSGWRAKLFGSWGLSLIIHNIVIVALALTMLPSILEPEPPSIVALPTTPDEELTQELDQDVTPSTEMSVSASSQSTLKTGHASTIQGATAPSFDKAVAESGPQVTVNGLSLTSVSGSALSMDVGDEAPGDPQAVVDSYDEAMDRITQEIMLMLAKGKVMVIWAFDQSESMKDDQEEIRQKINLVYQELGLQSAAQGDALITGVVSYGADFKVHTPTPTSDIERIRQAIGEVPIDTTGEEQMCPAVLATLQRYKKVATSGRRQLALILVTDESEPAGCHQHFRFGTGHC